MCKSCLTWGRLLTWGKNWWQWSLIHYIPLPTFYPGNFNDQNSFCNFMFTQTYVENRNAPSGFHGYGTVCCEASGSQSIGVWWWLESYHCHQPGSHGWCRAGGTQKEFTVSLQDICLKHHYDRALLKWCHHVQLWQSYCCGTWTWTKCYSDISTSFLVRYEYWYLLAHCGIERTEEEAAARVE